MDDFDFHELLGEEMYDSDPEESFGLDNIYHQIPVDMVIHLKSRQEPLFAEHVFFFEKDDPVHSIEELMNFMSTWWSAVSEDKNLDYIFLTDSSSNKKAILLDDVAVISFMAPPKPEWMEDGKDDTDSD
jgi:hypothetical protein